MRLFIADKPVIKQKVLYSKDKKMIMQFLLDFRGMAMVGEAYKHHGFIIHVHLLKVGLTWCRSLHRDRLKGKSY